MHRVLRQDKVHAATEIANTAFAKFFSKFVLAEEVPRKRHM